MTDLEMGKGSVLSALDSSDLELVRRHLGNLSENERSLLVARLGESSVSRMVKAAGRSRGGVQGRVVVIHGIMGGSLATVNESGGHRKVWLNYFRLLMGEIAGFKLNSAGGPADPLIKVASIGLLAEYLPLIVELSGRWEVLEFAYDWRLDIDQSADALNDAIRNWAGIDPVHIVAHSMGGLVSRRFIQRHPATWAQMRDGDEMRRGGRLIMLGTPNKGSFAIPFVLTGKEKNVQRLAFLDVKHNMGEVLDIINTFPGSYQMLPSPLVNGSDDRAQLYASKTWGTYPVPQPLLDQAAAFHQHLSEVITPERMIYVAGYDQKTPWKIKVNGPGKFSYLETRAGDDRVSHELGLLSGVETFYVRASHAKLPVQKEVLDCIDELLTTGTTQVLPTAMPATRALLTQDVWLTADEIAPVEPAIDFLGLPTRSPAQLSPEQAAYVEAKLVDSFVGSGGQRPTGPTVDGANGMVAAVPVRTVRVEIVWGDIVKQKGDVFAAGHYEGVLPQAGELALDRELSRRRSNTESDSEPGAKETLVITSHTQRRMIRGSVGDINFFPWARSRNIAAIAGMGHAGTFGRTDLKRLAQSLVNSVCTLPNAAVLNTLLIGSGTGNLSVRVALLAILEGIAQAMHGKDESCSLTTIRVVERDWRRASEMAHLLKEFSSSVSPEVSKYLQFGKKVAMGKGGEIGSDIAMSAVLLNCSRMLREATPKTQARISKSLIGGISDDHGLRQHCETTLLEMPAGIEGSSLEAAGLAGYGRIKPPEALASIPTRISCTFEEGGARVAAISGTTVVNERAVRFDWKLVEELVSELTDPKNPERASGFSDLLSRLIVPRDFRETLRSASNLVFEVDRKTSIIPWEMIARIGSASNRSVALGLDVPVSRQLRTIYSPPPFLNRDGGKIIRALVVGDPGDPAEQLNLNGARREAIEVAQLLQDKGVEVDLLLGARGDGNKQEVGQVRPATVINFLQALNAKRYDILHYAGHADFDPADPARRAGWLFGQSLFTARELESVDYVPELVVANACLTARLSGISRAGDESDQRGRGDANVLPGLVDEFFMKGVRNFIGTDWPISDSGAIEFAHKLYDGLLPDQGTSQDSSIGAALLAARKGLESRPENGALWAAYQHYGDATFSLKGKFRN